MTNKTIDGIPDINIHKTAIVDPQVTLSAGVTIGPYAVIQGKVAIGANVSVGSHCMITGNTTIGRGCQFYTGAVIGSAPQDKKYSGDENVVLIIGENNVFREYVTVNTGTADGGAETVIGNNNLFMAYSHVAHDCLVGNDCVMANLGTLAGHVTVEDRVVVGGLSGVHQFVRIGKYAIIGGCSKVVQDVPPYAMCDGNPAKIFGINSIGLRRANFPTEKANLLRKAYKILFHSNLNRTTAIERVQQEMESSPELDYLLAFIQNAKRGVLNG